MNPMKIINKSIGKSQFLRNKKLYLKHVSKNTSAYNTYSFSSLTQKVSTFLSPHFDCINIIYVLILIIIYRVLHGDTKRWHFDPLLNTTSF